MKQAVRSVLSIFLSQHFFKFVLVGTGGFLVDWLCLYLLTAQTDLSALAARPFSFSCATIFTWYCNATVTFRDVEQASKRITFMRYIVTNSAGFAINLSVYSGLILGFQVMQDHLTLPLMAGCLSGLVMNFLSSKFIVFRQKH